MLKDLAIVGTDECRELFDWILDETEGNTGHLLGKGRVLKNIQKKLDQLSFPSRQIKWIVNDIFGNPFVQEKEGLIQSEPQEEFNNRYKKFKNKWIEIEKNHTIRNGEDFVTYFEKFKLVEIREKMSRYATKKFKTKEHGQNPIEWLNYLSKDEIDTHDNVKQSHRHASILTCTKKLKNRSLRLYTNAIKAICSEGPYILSPEFSHLKHTYNEFMDMEREEKSSLIKRLFTYMPNERVLI